MHLQVSGLKVNGGSQTSGLFGSHAPGGGTHWQVAGSKVCPGAQSTGGHAPGGVWHSPVTGSTVEPGGQHCPVGVSTEPAAQHWPMSGGNGYPVPLGQIW